MEDGNQAIATWIAQARAAGLSDTAIQEKLIESGWKDYQAAALLQAQTPVAPPVVQTILPNETPKKHFSRRTLLTALGATLGVLILGGVAFGAWKGYIPVPGITKPEQLLEKSFAALQTVRGGEFTFYVDAVTEPLTPAAATYPADAQDALTADLPNPFAVHASISSFAKTIEGTDIPELLKQAKAVVKLQGDVTLGGSSFRGNLELRMLDGKLYLYAGTLPYIPIVDLTTFAGKWYVVEMTNNPLLDSLTAELGQTAKNANTGSDAMLQDAQAEIATFLKVGLQEKAITLKVNGKETIADVSTTRIDARIVPEQWSAFQAAYVADVTKRGKQGSSITKSLQELFAFENNAEFAAVAHGATLSIWVEGGSAMPRKMQFTSLVALPKVSGQADQQLNLSLGVMLGHINEEPVVEVPKNATSLEEALSDLLGGPRAQARNSQRKSDLGQIRTGLALFYDDRNQYPQSLTELVDSPNRYLSRLPPPPELDEKYSYETRDKNTAYTICALLEPETEGGQTSTYCIDSATGIPKEEPIEAGI
ncbi:MAG: hypothetical protein WCV85_06390 [Patescibacteria group bacterium]|jgi:hypothetical protein